MPARLLSAPAPRWLPRSVGWLSAALLLGITLADLLTPGGLVVGTLLTVPVALAALGGRRRLTGWLTALAVAANVGAGLLGGVRDAPGPEELGNRAISVAAVLLVGALSLRAREASARAARLAAEEGRLVRERALRRVGEAVGGALGEADFVARAAEALRELAGADSVEIGRLSRATLRGPHALSPPGAPSHLGRRLPLEVLARTGAEASGTDSPFVGHLRRAGEDDLLVLVTRPATEPERLREALATLEAPLERAALLDSLRVQGERLARRGEVLQDLVYAFSHDLRTPLLANSMNMRAALRGAYGPLPDAYRATLDNGLEANTELLALADQLLLLAKYESGEPGGERREVTLRDLTLGVIGQLEERARARGVVFEPELEGVRVYGLAHDLRRAVQNLLENAVKFSPPGGTVWVTLRGRGDEAVLAVTDEGPGVPPAREATLFGRFRGGGAGGGTGLGLYLTRQIAAAHGGTVTYARTARAQSVFTLTLPRGEAG
ncbi:signal transduction histidine kinase [Deinococcus sp. HSC-46F16]|uniref:sensor histidine kinase n=1 Tax=Deinococcus sp. HSC-46F16 TaxID=2910968 RepID=UPI00209E098F|nr:HAMP domain-containing sensor histidine kinase [Deinococcus sp. HSC-46F16]MCP2014602.1 signal transduction histidine kinase [Deinococcus sp. HSC-46F16]